MKKMAKPKTQTPLGLFALLALLTSTSSAATCYKLDGTAAYKDFTPCNEYSGAVSHCCGANRQDTNATFTEDVCLTNGLCLSVDGVEEWRYFRESCSTTDWPTSKCLRDVCPFPDQNDENGNAIMTPCENTTYSLTWCCGKNNTACCGTDSASTLAVTIGETATLTTSSSTSSTPSSTASAATTTSAATTSSTLATTSSASTDTPSLSSGAQAGIGVGVSLAAIAGLSTAVFFYLRHRRRAAATRNTALLHHEDILMQGTGTQDRKNVSSNVPHELDSRSMGYELDPANGLGEVEGDAEFKRT